MFILRPTWNQYFAWSWIRSSICFVIIGKLHFSANNPNIVAVLLDQSYVMPLQIMITQINNEMCILIINCGTWLPAWWAPWLLWWPLTDAAMFQCVYGYLQSVFFFLVLFHCCILLLEIKLTTTTTRVPTGPGIWEKSGNLKMMFLVLEKSVIMINWP